MLHLGKTGKEKRAGDEGAAAETLKFSGRSMWNIHLPSLEAGMSVVRTTLFSGATLSGRLAASRPEVNARPPFFSAAALRCDEESKERRMSAV